MSATPTTRPVPVDRPKGVNSTGQFIAVFLASLVNLAVLAGSFALSVNTVMSTAPWAGVDSGLAWLLPLSWDGLVLAATLAVVVARLRRRPTKRLWLILGAAVALSSLVNGAHAATYGEAPDAMTSVLGIAMVSGAPVIAAVCTHLLLDIIAAVTDPETDTSADTATDAETPALLASLDTRTGSVLVSSLPGTPPGQPPTPRQRPGHQDAMPGHQDGTPAVETPGQDTRTPRAVRVAAATSTTSPVRADARTSWSQTIETHRPDILTMATAGQSGRAIAATLGLNKDGVGRLISAARADGTLPPARSTMTTGPTQSTPVGHAEHQ